MKHKIVELTAPIGKISKIVLRNPTADDFSEVGLVWILKLADADLATLDALCPEDARALGEAMIDLLHEAAPLTVAAHFEPEGASTWH